MGEPPRVGKSRNLGNLGNLGNLENLKNMGNLENLGNLGNLGNLENLENLENLSDWLKNAGGSYPSVTSNSVHPVGLAGVGWGGVAGL